MDGAELEAIGRSCFALHARMTARLLTRVYDAAMRPLGLSAPQFGILGAIGHQPDVSETVLAERLGLERTTLIRNLRLLRQKGWIEAAPCERRGIGHRLTEAGEATLRAAIPAWRRAQHEIEAKLPPEQQEAIRRSLRSLRHALS